MHGFQVAAPIMIRSHMHGSSMEELSCRLLTIPTAKFYVDTFQFAVHKVCESWFGPGASGCADRGLCKTIPAFTDCG